LIIGNCSFTGNTAVTGGAILNDGHAGGSATITQLSNSVISGNTASGNGGGIENDGHTGGSATLVMSFTTVSANNAVHGAGIDNDGTGGSATLALGSTILSNGPNANLLLTVNSATTFTSKNHNLCSDAAGGDGLTSPGGLYLTAGGDIRNTDPKLGALSNN